MITKNIKSLESEKADINKKLQAAPKKKLKKRYMKDLELLDSKTDVLRRAEVRLMQEEEMKASRSSKLIEWLTKTGKIGN